MVGEVRGRTSRQYFLQSRIATSRFTQPALSSPTKRANDRSQRTYPAPRPVDLVREFHWTSIVEFTERISSFKQFICMTSEYLIGSLHLPVHEFVEISFVGKYLVPVEFMSSQIVEKSYILHFFRVHRIRPIIVRKIISHGQAPGRQLQSGADEGYGDLCRKPGLRRLKYLWFQLNGAAMKFSQQIRSSDEHAVIDIEWTSIRIAFHQRIQIWPFDILPKDASGNFRPVGIRITPSSPVGIRITPCEVDMGDYAGKGGSRRQIADQLVEGFQNGDVGIAQDRQIRIRSDEFKTPVMPSGVFVHIFMVFWGGRIPFHLDTVEIPPPPARKHFDFVIAENSDHPGVGIHSPECVQTQPEECDLGKERIGRASAEQEVQLHNRANMPASSPASRRATSGWEGTFTIRS